MSRWRRSGGAACGSGGAAADGSGDLGRGGGASRGECRGDFERGDFERGDLERGDLAVGGASDAAGVGAGAGSATAGGGADCGAACGGGADDGTDNFVAAFRFGETMKCKHNKKKHIWPHVDVLAQIVFRYRQIAVV